MARYSDPYQAAQGAWFTAEVSDDGVFAVPVRLVNADDPTAGVHIDYDSRCAMCWLGYAHSKRYHHLQINRHSA